ncbi:hypothetical protein L218DRAFT_966781 [Marasmius fiardii PR-910]|nr:hypothetical protein L218DRAFT_966781 [Marasmius fiardii PR-910]
MLKTSGSFLPTNEGEYTLLRASLKRGRLYFTHLHAPGKDIPAIAFCLIATVLLLIVCISSPYWDNVFFMEAGTKTFNSTTIRFGTFGYTHSNASIGYQDLDLWTLGIKAFGILVKSNDTSSSSCWSLRAFDIIWDFCYAAF